MEKQEKQPGETLDYDWNGDDWLAEDDFIVSATSTVSPSGLTIVSTNVFMSGTRVKVLVSGGTHLTKYKVTTTMTTDNGLVKEKEFQLLVKEK